MTEDYVTKEQLEERLKDLKRNPLSRVANSLVYLVSGLVTIATTVGAITYGAMSFAYGPYDTGKVIYAELSGDKSIKHRHVEEAKWLFSNKLHKQELDERDMKNLFLELGVVNSENKKPTEDDISWYNLLDWIEDND